MASKGLEMMWNPSIPDLIFIEGPFNASDGPVHLDPDQPIVIPSRPWFQFNLFPLSTY